MTTALEGGEWSAARPGRSLPPGKTRYPLYRRLCGLQGRSGRAENLAPPGFDPRTVQPVAQSLYRLSYRAHNILNPNKQKWKKCIKIVFCCAITIMSIVLEGLIWVNLDVVGNVLLTLCIRCVFKKRKKYMRIFRTNLCVCIWRQLRGADNCLRGSCFSLSAMFVSVGRGWGGVGGRTIDK